MKLSIFCSVLLGWRSFVYALPYSPLEARDTNVHSSTTSKSNRVTKTTKISLNEHPKSSNLQMSSLSHVSASSSKKGSSSSSHGFVPTSSRRTTSHSIHTTSSTTHSYSISSHVTTFPSSSTSSPGSYTTSSTHGNTTLTLPRSTSLNSTTDITSSSFSYSNVPTSHHSSPTSATEKRPYQTTCNNCSETPSTSSRLTNMTVTAAPTETYLSNDLRFSASLANITATIPKHFASNELGTSTSISEKMNATILGNLNYISSSASHLIISPSGLASKVKDSNVSAKCTKGTFVDASCFDELALSDYLHRWWALNEVTCVSKNIQFAQCFFALETKYAPSNCAQINEDAACTQPIWEDFENSHDDIQRFYVAWNLWNTAGFFLDMWTAIGAAEASSEAGLASIVNLLDPPKDEHVALNYILDALTFGLSLYAEGSLILKALLRSMPQTGGLTGKLFPSGTVDGEYQDWSVIAANIGKCTDSFRESVVQGLPTIQNNITAFILWSKVSGLSGNRAPLHGLAESMTQALNTYAISRILTTQGIVVARAPDTDIHALQTNGSQINWDTGCGAGYDNLGLCDTFFWDGKDTYGLIDPDHFTKGFHDELASFFKPNGVALPLTTGRLLFSGAQSCYEATGQNGGVDPLLDPTDISRIRCLSTVPVCTWDRAGYGPFDRSCKNLPEKDAVLPGFGVSGCRGQVESTNSINVPRAYLGPGIWQNGANVAEIQRDDFCDNVDF